MSFGDRPWDGKTEKELNQEVAVRPPVAEVSGFEMRPRTLDEAMEFCRIMADSELVAPSYRNKPGNVMVAIQMGQELGLSPMRALRCIAVINGRASMWGDEMLAMVLASPACEYVHEQESTDAQGVCKVKRKGDPEEHVSIFTLADAKRAGLLGKQGPWQTSTKRMLQLRARGFALRDKFPDVLAGLVTVEEALDLPRKVEESLEKAPTEALVTLKDRLKAKVEQTVEPEPSTVLEPTVEEAVAEMTAQTVDDPAEWHRIKLRTCGRDAQNITHTYNAIPEELRQDCHAEFQAQLQSLRKKK